LVSLAEPWLVRRVRQWQAFVMAVSALAGAVATVVVLRDSQPFPGFLAVLPVLATCGLLIAGGGKRTRVIGWLRHPWIVWVGDQSYSWYLWHWPLIVYVRMLSPTVPTWVLLLAGLLGLPLAWLTGRSVENPFRRDHQILGWRAVRLAVLCGALPSIAFGGIVLYDHHPPLVMRQLAWEARAHLDATRPCIRNFPGTAMTRRCTWTVPASKGRLLLLGDSNAGQFAEPMLRVARARGLDFTLATYGGCPFVPLSAVYAKVPHDTVNCDSFVRQWSAEIARTRPTIVFLASVTPNYIESNAISFTPTGASGGASTSPTRKAELWRRGLIAMMSGWRAHGVSTVVVNTVPQFGTFDLAQCPAYLAYQAPARCASQARTADLAKFEARARAAEDRAVAQVPGATSLDLFNVICGMPTCSTYQHEQFAYRDGVHLSVSFAEGLQPEFAAALDRALAARTWSPATGSRAAAASLRPAGRSTVRMVPAVGLVPRQGPEPAASAATRITVALERWCPLRGCVTMNPRVTPALAFERPHPAVDDRGLIRARCAPRSLACLP
ncbi:MAG: acyltransferase family protein, partial [Mycobacteriaceae bacterium]